MHLRLVNASSGRDKIRRYAQLVSSYRRDDGVPAHRVLANLGELGDREIENLRLALKASRAGQAVVLPAARSDNDWSVRIEANLHYLDCAVALAMWRYWKLPELFNRLLPRGLEVVPASAIIAALAIQRCVDPGSKLYAARWFPRTALPELLDVTPQHFNNTRLHRVLDDLDRVEAALQEELPKRYQQRDATFAALFLDVTDTYFEGRGCDLAQRNRTKEGLANRRMVGVVLLCNEHGYPLRWQVIPGKRRDPQSMGDMVDSLSDVSWVREAPLVCDRAMGTASGVARLVTSGLRFLTATTVSEIASYTDAIPWQTLVDLIPVGNELSLEFDMEQAAARVLAAGMEKVDDVLYVLELGVCKRTLSFARPCLEVGAEEHDPQDYQGAASYLATARIYQGRLDRKEVRTRTELARQEGLTKSRVTQIMNLLRLDVELQERLFRGDFGHVPEHVMRGTVLRQHTTAARRRALEEYAERARPVRGQKKLPTLRRTGRQETELRLVVYFNPRMFVESRDRANRRRQRIDDFVADLNRRLAAATRTREKESVYTEVATTLIGHNLLGVYRIHIKSVAVANASRARWQVDLEIDEEEWRRRRRYDGFVLLVGHPELPQSARGLVQLYRDRDAVEKDFQTIKDVIKLRPVYHYTDPKVRAHVTLCMMALLMERTLERRLRQAGHKETAASCFEELGECRLNLLRVAPEQPAIYAVTDATAEQRAILKSLRLTDLVDDKEVTAGLHPRVAS